MRLGDLLQMPIHGADVEVAGVASDSRRVRPGDVFFALAGMHTDGRRHVAEAVARGARAIVATADVDAPGATSVRHPAPRALLGQAAARLLDEPSRHLTVVGVTG